MTKGEEENGKKMDKNNVINGEKTVTIDGLRIGEIIEYYMNKYYPDLVTNLDIRHAHLINLPKALDPNEQPVMCSVCKSVTSLYHGYKPKYCSNCGCKFDEEEIDEI